MHERLTILLLRNAYAGAYIQLSQEFLNTSQLTYHGLAALHEGLQPGALAVFFRNNHFNVLAKVCANACPL